MSDDRADQDHAYWVKELQRRSIDLETAQALNEPADRVAELQRLVDEADQRRMER